MTNLATEAARLEAIALQAAQAAQLKAWHAKRRYEKAEVTVRDAKLAWDLAEDEAYRKVEAWKAWGE